MKLRFLGTGAATAAPLPFCRCAFCRELRARGIFRRRASLLINDDLIIDFGPDVPLSAAESDVDLTKITTVLQTHSHADHFDAGHFVTRIPGYAPEDLPPLTVMGSPETIAHIREKMMREEGDDADLTEENAARAMRLMPHAFTPGQMLHTCRYDILPIAVPHDVRDGSVIYLIHDTADEKTILYATDCPPFTDDVWQQLAKFRLDCAIMDHTYGTDRHAPCTSHMDAHQFAAMLRRLRTEGILKAGAPAYATHLSHEAHVSVAVMESFAQENDYLLPVDGQLVFL